jgi:hypothetical protein
VTSADIFGLLHLTANSIVTSFGEQAASRGWKPDPGSLGDFDSQFDEPDWPAAPGGLVGHAALTLIAAGGGFLDDIGYLIADAETPGRAALSLDPLTRAAVEHLSTGLWILAPEHRKPADDGERRSRVERAWIHMVDAAHHYDKGRDADEDRTDGIRLIEAELGPNLTGRGQGRKIGRTGVPTLTERSRCLEELAFGPSPDQAVRSLYAHLCTSAHPNFHALYELSRNGATHFTLLDRTILDSFRVAAVSFATAWAEVARYHGWETDAADEAKQFCLKLNPTRRAAR